VTFESDDYETVQGLVASGVGVALIPRLAVTHVHPGVVVRSLAPKPLSRRVVAATLAAAGVAPAAGTMIEILAAVAERYTEGPARSAA
jgi:DNA-binding transcriptional LysR family regulator